MIRPFDRRQVVLYEMNRKHKLGLMLFILLDVEKEKYCHSDTKNVLKNIIQTGKIMQIALNNLYVRLY